MLRPKTCTLFLAIILVIGAVAQQSQPKRYSFMHYGSAAGLASNEVFDVTQDAEGFIWIATSGGLQRFDGVRFLSFISRKNNPAGIPDNFVSDLLIDRKRQLWIQTGGTRTGIFDMKRFKFHEVPVRPQNPMALYANKELFCDDEGNVMLMLWSQELLTYDPKKDEFSPSASFIRLPADWRVTGFCTVPGTKKYVIGTTKGLVVYNKQTNQYNYTGHNPEKESLIEQMGKITGASQIFIDRQGRCWFNSWEIGACVEYAFNLETRTIIHNFYSFGSQIKAYHELGKVMQQRNGDLWIRGLGIFGRYLEKEKQFQLVYNGFENEQSIYYDNVFCLFEDREENIWVATNNNGLYRFNPHDQFFTNIRQVNRGNGKPGDGGVMSFAPTKWGTYLIGSWGDGLYNLDRDFNTIPLNIRGISEMGTASMWSMVLSRDSNTIWLGAQPGIWKIDQARRTAMSYNPPAMRGITVRQIVEDRFGNLWMGMQGGGVFKWDAEKGKHRFEDGISRLPGIPSTMILRMIVDRAGRIWVGTSSLGLYVVDPSNNKIIMHFGPTEPPERNLVGEGATSILQYDDTTMIIAGRGFAVYSIPQKRIVRTIGLPESFAGGIAAMERDSQGYLWVSTSQGIYRVNIHNKIFINFSRADGIINDRFVLAASCVLNDGRILFGAENQFVCFDPAAVQINNFSPDIEITGFSLMNRPLLVDSLLKKDRIELGPKENSVVIEFSGLSYNNAYLIRYKLEGLDHDWKLADKSFQAIYSYLPPGTYTFLARSEDAEGVPGKNITRLVILVHPPFWKTWWFFCLLALSIAAVFFWLDQQRVKKLVALQRVRSEIASNLHEDVNTTLNNINVLSEMARIKADKDISRSKEYIEQISSKSHNMIIAMDDILWSIDPHNDSMEKSLLRMMEFADALKNRHGANIELALDRKVRTLKLDMKIRHEILIIFKEALRMIVQYSAGRDTLVHIDLFKNKLSVKLQDPGASLDKNTEEIDACIKEINNRAAMIGADLDVQYDRSGIAIILLIPVR